jgi:hypothetical protein
MQLIYKQSPLGEVQDIDSKNGIVKGYASYFDNKDSDNDIIKRGAYKKTIEENGYRVKYYYQHKLDQPLGKMRDVLELMRNGIITENSVGIMPIQKEIKEGYRELTEVKLYEISAVSLASNDQAKILDVKGMKNFDDVYKRYDNLCKLIRKGNISDEMGYALEAEILKLKGVFTSLATQPAEATEPEVKNDSSAYRLLIDKLK